MCGLSAVKLFKMDLFVTWSMQPELVTQIRLTTSLVALNVDALATPNASGKGLRMITV